MAIGTIDALIAGMLPPRPYYKATVTGEGASTWHSLWKIAGNPGAGANPPLFTAGSGYIPTAATAGAIPYTNPVSGNGYLARVMLSSSIANGTTLYDRVWACSGFGTVVTTAQNVTTPGSLTRDANGGSLGDGVELWGEVYTAPGATAATWTVSYTNSAGVAGRSATYAHPANAETVGQMFPFTLQAGDVGVRSVQSFTCSVSSGTAGDIGITLVRRLATIPLPSANNGITLDAVGLGLPRIYDNTCLTGLVLMSAGTTGIIIGEVVFTQG